MAASLTILCAQCACARTKTIVPEATRRVQTGAAGRRVEAAAGAVRRHKVLQMGGEGAISWAQCACALALRVLLHFYGGAVLVADTCTRRCHLKKNSLFKGFRETNALGTRSLLLVQCCCLLMNDQPTENKT